MPVRALISSGLRYLRDLWCGADPASPDALTDQSNSGAALVEFTILMPVFFLILFGMVEFGSMVWLQNNMTNAAREGARTAAVQGGSATKAACNWLSGASQTFQISVADQCPASPDVTVQITILKSNASLFNAFLSVSNTGTVSSTGWGGSLSASVTMRKENTCTTTIAAASCPCNTSGATPTGC